MNNIRAIFTISITIVSLLCAVVPAGEAPKTIQLMSPQTDGGRPLMKALKDRSTSRSFGSEKLPIQVLSNLLWAAFGMSTGRIQESGLRRQP